jgi:hypothetical protein
MSGLLFYFLAVTRLDSALSQNPCVGVFNCCQVFRQLQRNQSCAVTVINSGYCFTSMKSNLG